MIVIVGIETLAIVVSSTCMNVASASARSVTPWGIPAEEPACDAAASIASDLSSQRSWRRLWEVPDYPL
jgi:hypothetical protein